MRINNRLNLVIPVERDGGVVYVHSSPISREVFEAHFLVISKTFSAIYAQGLNYISGPRVAAMLLKKVATELDAWDGDLGAERGLMNEIRRLSNVVAPGPKGWATFPLQEAIDRKYFDADDESEVMNGIVFFIVNSAMQRKTVLPEIMDGAARLWGALITSSNCTEYADSLPTLIEAESSGATVTGLSLPS